MMKALISSLFALVLASSAQSASLGLFESHQDIGTPKIPGSADYDRRSKTYTLTAAGQNMWGSRDECHFLWKRLKGDFVLQARVEWIGKGVDPHRKLGWMVRTSLDADASYVDGAVHGDGLTSLQFRRSSGGATEQVRSTATAPDFVQLERRGNTYTLSATRSGEPTSECKTNLPLSGDVYAGLFLCSHNSNVVEKAVFKDVRILRPGKTGTR